MTTTTALRAGALLLLGLVACREQPKQAAAPQLPAGTVILTPARLAAAKLRADTVRLRPVSLPLAVPATLETPAPATAHVGSIVEGRVDEVLVLPGDRVAAGAPLLRIHSHELATAVRDLRTAEAELAAAQAAYDRSSRLLAAEAVSKEEVERRLAALEAARAERRRAAEVIDHLKPSTQGDVTVVAPRAGTVFAVHVTAGTAVTPGAPLVDLGDASRLWATGYVPETAALTVTPGTRVALRLEVLPGDTLRGRVVRAGGVVDSIRRAVEVRVELDRVPPGVRPGMFASLVLPSGAREDRVVLPEQAVQRMADGEVVFVQESPGRFRARRVKAVPLSEGFVAVEGLTPGLVVVTEGAYFVRAALEGAPAEEG